MFEPNEDDELWQNQHQYNLLSWSLYDFCGIHMLLMENGIAIHMLTEKKYPLSQEMISKMLKKRLEVDHESTQAIEFLRFIRSQPQENSLLAQTGDMATFMDWFCKQRGLSELTPKDLEGPAFEIIKVFHPDVIHLQFQMEECHKLLTDQVDDAIIRYNVSKPLPLGGEPGHVTIQPDFFFNKDLEYLRYGRKVGRPALSISKMKAAYYPDVGLEQLVPDQFWIAEECKYDIAAMYGISHWWFQRQRFYIDRFSSEGDRRAVRTHMRILSVVRIEVFSMYGYNYMKKIVLRRADLKEYVIAERDFKHMYPSDFEDLYLLNLQGHLNHLSPEDKKILTTAVNLWTRNLVIRHRVEDFQLGIESYQTQLNLTKHRWEATGFEFKHDYTVIDSPRAVTFRDRYGVQMIMRFNEIHKFSDGTLQQIDEALDYRVKEFQINRTNPGMHTRFWTKKDVDRSKDFMFAIQKRLKTRRIFRNLESFVGGRIREGDYRSVLTDPEDQAKDEMEHLVHRWSQFTYPQLINLMLPSYSQNSKAYIILNKHTRKVIESLNVTFDETPPPSKTSPLVDDDLDEEEAIKVTEKKNLENDIVDETLEIDKIVNIKESRNHPLENVIGNLNQRTLRSQAQEPK
ncbi:hypothetical protein Tco_1176076 [Tanacetum coccineum]